MDAQKEWYLNLSPGVVYVPPVPLTINQTGFEQISLWADYETAPLKSPIYYSYRIGFTNENSGWEAEMNHLKIYLSNRPEEIQRFSISHGYNQLFINRVLKLKAYGIKIGAGIVLAHPENTIRQQPLVERRRLFNIGYCLAGPALQFDLFHEFPLSKRFYLLAESKVSFAYAKVPVANGKADVPVVGFHLQFGAGCFFHLKKIAS